MRSFHQRKLFLRGGDETFVSKGENLPVYTYQIELQQVIKLGKQQEVTL